jgi:hypothetical protein
LEKYPIDGAVRARAPLIKSRVDDAIRIEAEKSSKTACGTKQLSADDDLTVRLQENVLDE